MATTVSPPRPPIVNIPNILTSSRFVLALILFGLIHANAWLACLGVFVLAAITDWLDGYLARKQGLTSTLGRNLDPLVDKVLICGAFVFLIPVSGSEVTPWMAVVVLARELVITSLRSFLENSGVVFGADWLGKLKMGLQCAALIAVFIALQTAGKSWDHWIFPLAQVVLLYAMIAATALSGLQYLWKATQLLKSPE